MSKLDELKKQAEEATLRDQVKTSVTGPTEEQRWRKLAPVMKYLQDHFSEVVKTLNVLVKGGAVDFKISDSISMKSLRGKNYKITHPTADKEREFIFEFENVGEHPCYANIPAGPLVAKFKDTFNNNQIKFQTTPLDNIKSVKFEIKPLVRSKYRFTADVEKESISLTITNYKDLWSKTNNFKKHEITTELMDELTKHILREPNKYDEMVGNVISDAERTRIKENLKTQLNAQAAQSQATTQPRQPPKKEKGLLGKLFKKD